MNHAGLGRPTWNQMQYYNYRGFENLKPTNENKPSISSPSSWIDMRKAKGGGEWNWKEEKVKDVSSCTQMSACHLKNSNWMRSTS